MLNCMKIKGSHYPRVWFNLVQWF